MKLLNLLKLQLELNELEINSSHTLPTENEMLINAISTIGIIIIILLILILFLLGKLYLTINKQNNSKED